MVAGCHTSLVTDISPDDILQKIENEKITCTLMVLAVIQMLVPEAEAKGVTRTGLKTIVCGASPTPAEVLKRAQLAIPETDFIHVYGMT